MAGDTLEPPFQAYTGDEPYVFVSYAHADSAVVYPELIRLHEAGYRIWYDEGISIGHDWPEEIALAIERCAHFVVYLSPRAVQSRNVLNEIHAALDEDIPFCAIHLEEARLSGGLKLRISRLQAIERHKLGDATYWRKLQSALPKSVIELKSVTPEPLSNTAAELGYSLPVVEESPPMEEIPETPESPPQKPAERINEPEVEVEVADEPIAEVLVEEPKEVKPVDPPKPKPPEPVPAPAGSDNRVLGVWLLTFVASTLTNFSWPHFTDFRETYTQGWAPVILLVAIIVTWRIVRQMSVDTMMWLSAVLVITPFLMPSSYLWATVHWVFAFYGAWIRVAVGGKLILQCLAPNQYPLALFWFAAIRPFSGWAAGWIHPQSRSEYVWLAVLTILAVAGWVFTINPVRTSDHWKEPGRSQGIAYPESWPLLIVPILLGVALQVTTVPPPTDGLLAWAMLAGGALGFVLSLGGRSQLRITATLLICTLLTLLFDCGATLLPLSTNISRFLGDTVCFATFLLIGVESLHWVIGQWRSAANSAVARFGSTLAPSLAVYLPSWLKNLPSLSPALLGVSALGLLLYGIYGSWWVDD